ncbi:unnamed protein product, partial [Meganyctiphanes norvegica]
MESKLSIYSRQEFDKKLGQLINPLGSLLERRHKKFNKCFHTLMNHSRHSFDTMFVKTYGILYQQNSEVFTDLYHNLEVYYTQGRLNLNEAMNKFFQNLYQRMFSVYNSQYQFSSQYLSCVTGHMSELAPFGDVPMKLTTQIRRSFTALRTFVQGLQVAKTVLNNVLKENPSLTCVHDLMKMWQCSTCQGEVDVHPCLAYCNDVIDNCLAHHRPIVQHWHGFVDAMVQVAERLENPFNIENVVEPINYKVSDAIMNFQEAGHEISKKVFFGCGQPQLGGDGTRNKRQASDEREIAFESLNFNGGRSERRGKKTDTIGNLVHEIKMKMRNSRSFWDELPKKMCGEVKNKDDAKCWTGTTLGKYESKGLPNVSSIIESSPQMNMEIVRLTIITKKLKEAYNGRDISWIDDERLIESSSHRASMDVSSGDWTDDGSADHEDGSGGGFRDHRPSHNYPIDDEDGDLSGGSGYDSSDDHYGTREEGSASGPWEPKPMPPISPYEPDIDTNVPNYQTPIEQPPSAAAAEPMSLTRALSVFLLPAFLALLNSL